MQNLTNYELNEYGISNACINYADIWYLFSESALKWWNHNAQHVFNENLKREPNAWKVFDKMLVRMGLDLCNAKHTKKIKG